MPPNETIVFQADRYNIHRIRYQGPDGSAHSRDIIRHPGAVVLLPLLNDGRVVLIRNYRVSLGRELLEVPAGTMEIGEPPEQTAHRELIEETGYTAGKLEHLRTFYASPGICDEAMHLFLATDLTAGDPNREAYEQITNQPATLPQIVQWMRDGTIQDGKTLIALLDFQSRF